MPSNPDAIDNDLLARIAKGTKRKRRDISLLDVSTAMRRAYDKMGSLKQVAKAVKLSPEMVRQFLKVCELEEGVKEMIRLGSIRSVDICYRLSGLRGDEQIALARHIVDKGLSSKDVRDILRYKVANPRTPVEEAVRRTLKSKNRRVYVAFLPLREETYNQLLRQTTATNRITLVNACFDRLSAGQPRTGIELKGRVIVLRLPEEGVPVLRGMAKQLRVPLKGLAEALVSARLSGAQQ